MGNDKSLKRKYNAESKNIKNLIIGIVNIVIALVVYLWASNHSPHMDLGEMLLKYDSYLIK